MVTRRGLLATTAALAAATAACEQTEAEFDPSSWASVRAQFALDSDHAHFAAFVFASHPAPVRTAIDGFAANLDRDPVGYLASDEDRLDRAVTEAAATYLKSGEIAFTDSTTAGLGLLYSGLKLAPGDEILTTEHDFYATHESLRLLAERTGCTVRRVRLYSDPATATEDQILSALGAALSPKVAVVALTWVHSGTGVRLPVAAMADLIRAKSRALVCLDAVHGFGARRERPADLKVDFYVSGGHKWLFGPRGTGLIWGSNDGWSRYAPVVPSFSRGAIGAWMAGRTPSGSPGVLATPGGYHTFENRWALAAAFDFHQRIGPDRIADRTGQLAAKLKDGIADLDHVTLVTPRSPDLSAGLVCCTVDGKPPNRVVQELRAEHRVIASVTPYATALVRFGTSVVTDDEDVDRALGALKELR